MEINPINRIAKAEFHNSATVQSRQIIF